MNATKTVPCPTCSGQGKHFNSYAHLNAFAAGRPTSNRIEYERCHRCHGEGTIEIEVIPPAPQPLPLPVNPGMEYAVGICQGQQFLATEGAKLRFRQQQARAYMGVTDESEARARETVQGYLEQLRNGTFGR